MGPKGDIEGFDDNGKVVGAVHIENEMLCGAHAHAHLHADYKCANAYKLAS